MEEIEVVLADRNEVKRILKEERVAIMCAYMLMHFLKDEEPFAFLEDLGQTAYYTGENFGLQSKYTDA